MVSQGVETRARAPLVTWSWGYVGMSCIMNELGASETLSRGREGDLKNGLERWTGSGRGLGLRQRLCSHSESKKYEEGKGPFVVHV